jgi:hypothetical protein
LNGRDLAITILIGLLIITSSVAVYQQVFMITPPKSTPTTTTLTTTQTVIVSSSRASSPLLLGSRGIVHILTPGTSGSITCFYCFYYFQANDSDERSFYFGVSYSNQSGTYHATANFSESLPPRDFVPFDVQGITCKYYTVTFQEKYPRPPFLGPFSSEDLGVCAWTEIMPTSAFNFTMHTNPQAGLAYSPNGTLYFLVSQVYIPGAS